ncbi:MAG: carbohydrate kinase [Candidatus Sulfotelmatobacter sp.]
MLTERHIVVGLGELLWDLLPAGKQLGGAPANFAYITNLLGDTGIPASRVGRDSLGDEAVERLALLKVNAAAIQRDPVHPTGTVKVEIDHHGQPRFDISQPVAWDFLEWAPAWRQLAGAADAVCFGSLAQRSSQSQTAIRSFLQATRPAAVRIFDVNLRQNFYTPQVLTESMRLATIVKLNHEELPEIMRLFELENFGEENSAQQLLSLYGLNLVCVTCGNGGSFLVSPVESSRHPGFRINVADTVGAGDAFTAALVHGYLRGTSLAQINETANRVGAWVATQSGATPTPKAGGLLQALSEIG